MKRTGISSRLWLAVIALIASVSAHCWSTRAFALTSLPSQIVITDAGRDYLNLTVPVAYAMGRSSEEALLSGVKNPESFEAYFGARTIYVAVPDCDGVSVECSLNSDKQGPGGGVLRKPREKLVSVIAVSRIRNQSVAALSVDVGAIQRLQLENEESFQLKLRFRNARGSISSDLGPMERSLGRLLVRERVAIRGRGVSRPIVATADGQVTWATGSTWQQARDSAIDANTDYLMIMADELSDSLVESLASKRATVNDLNVTIVKMSQIDADPDTVDTPATIRDLIKGVYDSRSAAHSSDSLLSYVLLIGDAVRPDTTTLIPSYNGFTSYYGGSEALLGRVDASDSYYSLLSEEDAEDDVFPDVFLGRLPVDAVSGASPPDPDWELRNVVNKIWGYQPNSLLERRMLMVSGGTKIPGLVYQQYFGYLMGRLPTYVVADSLHRLDYPLDDDSLDTDGPKDQAFSDSVYTRLNTDEYSVFAYFDHGNPFYLPESFFAMHYDSLKTENSLPLALLFGTDIGRFDLPAFNSKSYGSLHPYSPANPRQVSIAELDSCDVVAERLVVQKYGAIGAIAMSRTTSEGSAANPFTSMMRAVFEENALSLGEVLLTTRLLMYPSGAPDRNLMLFGDPALNILWENSVATSDTIDLSISASDIRPLDAVRGRYVSSSSATLAVGVRNKGTADATGVAYGVWEGPPATGTLLASGEIAAIPGFNHIAWDTITVSGTQPGVVELFVQVDSTAYLEPTYVNNVASRKIYAYDYQPGFPISLNDRTTHSVTLADIRTDNLGDEILIQTTRALRCFDTTGQSLWQVTSQGMPGYADNANGTPLVANVYKNAVPYAAYLDGIQGSALKAYLVNGYGTKVDSVAIEPQSWFIGNAILEAHATKFILADLVGDDDALELITVSGGEFLNGPKYVRAYSIEADSLLWECLVGDDALGHRDAANVALGDIDLDGAPEVLIRLSTTSDGVDSLYCIRSNGDCYWGVEGGRRAKFVPYDVAMVAATGAQSGEMNVLTTARDVATGEVKVVEVDSLGASQTIVTEAGGEQSLVFSSADVDGDGAVELVMGRDSTLAVYELNGSPTAELVSDVGIMRINPLLVDVNGDDQTEVIMLSGGENPYSPDESQYVIDVMTMNLELLTRFEFPFRAKDVGSEQPFGGPAVGDIDHDGIAELAFVSLDSVLHVIELGQMGRSPWPQRYGNPMQTNVAVQSVKGTYNGPVSLFNTVEVVDDVAFNEATYVDGTATIRVADDDPTPPGSPSADDKTVYTDIIVRDEFRSIGSEYQRIRFMSWDGSAESSNPWWSIFVSDSTLTASGEFVHTEIRGAQSGITARKPISVLNCLIEDCSEKGLSVASADTVIVTGTTIRGADYGINALDGTTVLLSNSIIEDCAEYGVAVYKNSRLEATETTLNGNGIATYLAKESASWVAGTVRDCDFSNNAHGIWVSGTGDSVIVVEGCTIIDNSTTGMYLEMATVVVDGTTMRGAELGITANPGTTLLLSNSIVEDASLYGVLAEGARADITGTSFDGNDTALYLGYPSSWVQAAVSNCSFTSNGDGIWIDDVGDSSVVVDDCTIDDNTTNGVYVENNGDVSLTRNTITNNAVGVFSFGSNPMIRSRNVIQYNAGGISCDSYSVAVVESSTVNNNTNGVVVSNGSNPDLGHETGGSSLGQNIMRPNTTYHAVNFTSNDISMQNNYIPRNPPTQCNPQTTKFYGSFDYEPHLGCDAPDLSLRYQEPLLTVEEDQTILPPRFRLGQNFPNPFNPVTTVTYEVPKPGSQVEIGLYDVGGRLVAVLVDEHRAPGFYSVTWDGVNRNGEPVASGVYFLRMRAGHFVDTKKLLLLK